ncbi:MAG: GntR-family transcriptional regulator [Verrucomicrobia bacterium]|nr:GntR-family transcriptional regulator [Verrucomicrobiota bacterium]
MKKVNSDVAYDYIRKRILSGEYPPGHALMTEELSGVIGVSRTPVREALHKLKADGLVSIRARLGASVKKMDVKEFREMCDMRLALEGHATALAALNHSQADLREIRFALDGMRGLTERLIAAEEESPLLDELVREDVRFHIAIMTAAKNDLMKGEILRLHLVNRIVFGPVNPTSGVPVSRGTKPERDENRRRVLASHDEIYDAIARGDAIAAKRAMEDHIQDIIEKGLRIMAHSGAGLITRELTDEELVYNG